MLPTVRKSLCSSLATSSMRWKTVVPTGGAIWPMGRSGDGRSPVLFTDGPSTWHPVKVSTVRTSASVVFRSPPPAMMSPSRFPESRPSPGPDAGPGAGPDFCGLLVSCERPFWAVHSIKLDMVGIQDLSGIIVRWLRSLSGRPVGQVPGSCKRIPPALKVHRRKGAVPGDDDGLRRGCLKKSMDRGKLGGKMLR